MSSPDTGCQNNLMLSSLTIPLSYLSILCELILLLSHVPTIKLDLYFVYQNVSLLEN